jgi:hypothetical protein
MSLNRLTPATRRLGSSPLSHGNPIPQARRIADWRHREEMDRLHRRRKGGALARSLDRGNGALQERQGAPAIRLSRRQDAGESGSSNRRSGLANRTQSRARRSRFDPLARGRGSRKRRP